MKKTLTRFTAIIFMGALLLSLTGCGGLLNGDKKLTADHLTEEASLGGSSSSNIKLKKIYFIDYVNSTSTDELYPIFSGVSSSDYLYVISLEQTSSGFSVSSTSTSRTTTYANAGFTYYEPAVSFDLLPDAYMIGTKSSSYNTGYKAVSNVITYDDFIEIKANDPTTWNRGIGKCFSTSGSERNNRTSEPYNSQSTLSSTYKYLWIQLDSQAWVCLGNVYN